MKNVSISVIDELVAKLPPGLRDSDDSWELWRASNAAAGVDDLPERTRRYGLGEAREAVHMVARGVLSRRQALERCGVPVKSMGTWLAATRASLQQDDLRQCDSQQLSEAVSRLPIGGGGAGRS